MDNKLENKSFTADDIMESVRKSTNVLLDNLTDGERTTLKDLIDKVVAETKVQISMANGLVPMFVHEWVREGHGSIDKGRNGGVFKGGKPVRIDPRPRCETCNQVIRPKTKK